ncbi:diacylglycerol kinase [Salmonella enterica subsp. enterica serovar Senftenberg]|nr:diacylglycerol kinase [Salmonella enterica subsp. enterica serovar Senftenberg]
MHQNYQSGRIFPKGFRAAWTHEAAFRRKYRGIAGRHHRLLAGCGCDYPCVIDRFRLLIMIVEILNSAIEAVVDRIGSEYHELSGRAKDMGSAAVLLSIFVALMTGHPVMVTFSIKVPNFINLLFLRRLWFQNHL